MCSLKHFVEDVVLKNSLAQDSSQHTGDKLHYMFCCQ